MDQYIATYGQPLFIGAIIGLILGWLVTWLVFRSRGKKTQASIQDLESKLVSANSSLSQAQAKGQKLEVDLKAAQASVQDLDARLADANQSLIQTRSHEEQLETDLKAAQVTVADQEAAYNALQAETAATVAQLTNSAGDLSRLQTDYQQLKQERNTLNTNLEASLADLAQARQSLATATKVISDKEVALNEAYLRGVTLQRELMEHQTLLASTQTELASLRRDVGALTSLNQELEGRMHNARGEVAGELALLTATMLRMKEDTLNQANRQIEALQAEVEMMKAGKVALR